MLFQPEVSNKLVVFLLLFIFQCGCSLDQNLKIDRVVTKNHELQNSEIKSERSLKGEDPWKDKYITGGVGTKSVHLGMSREELLSLLGEPNDQTDYNVSCVFSHLHWYPPPNPDGSVDDGEIFAFLKDGKVFEIRFDDAYRSSDGITGRSILSDLKKKISAPIFELNPSANTSTNNENLYFMIRKDRGIAYEIAAGYQRKERGVSAIYVFYPNSDFLPWGCIDESQTLARIQDFD